jgi:nucleoside 2-deoxyribosyltransferase
MSEEKKQLTCGIIMPISPIDGCGADHWVEVKQIISESIKSIEKYIFNVNLVSDADDIGVIQKRIVQNIYNSDIVVCDVSGKNSNVMFELGMRLAFDKPTIIIKDDKTNYSFDTSIIEHLEYPRDLRFSHIVNFKEKLANKVVATYEKSINDSQHSTFLKNFGSFKVAKLTETEISADKMVLEMLTDLQRQVSNISRAQKNELRKARRVGTMSEKSAKLLDIAIDSYIHTNNIEDIKSLVNNSEFYRQLEREIDAPEHFESPEEFERAVNNNLFSSLIRVGS